jgi:hypothetical protein
MSAKGDSELLGGLDIRIGSSSILGRLADDGEDDEGNLGITHRYMSEDAFDNLPLMDIKEKSFKKGKSFKKVKSSKKEKSSNEEKCIELYDDDRHKAEVRAATKNLKSMGLAAGGKLSK